MTEDAIKVTVLSSGAILLEGKTITLGELEDAFKSAKQRNAPVWYYREAAASEPLPEGMRVPAASKGKWNFRDQPLINTDESHPR